MIERLVTVEQQLCLTVPEVSRNTVDAKLINEYVEQEDASSDKSLRIESDSMAATLEGKNAELMVKLAALEGIVAQAQLGGGGSASPEKVEIHRPGVSS